MNKVDIKERLKQCLEIRGITQSQLAIRANIDKGQLSSYISGKYKPRQNNIDALAKALNVSEAWLMGFDVPMERQPDPVPAPAPLPADQQQLNDLYTQLDSSNKKKVITYATNLLSTQRMEDELQAAHDHGATPEQKKHADDIMMDPKEWE